MTHNVEMHRGPPVIRMLRREGPAVSARRVTPHKVLNRIAPYLVSGQARRRRVESRGLFTISLSSLDALS